MTINPGRFSRAVCLLQLLSKCLLRLKLYPAVPFYQLQLRKERVLPARRLVPEMVTNVKSAYITWTLKIAAETPLSWSACHVIWQVTAQADGTELVTVTSPDFAAAVFDLYVGATPVSAEARTNALHAAARMMAFPGTSLSCPPCFTFPTHALTHARTQTSFPPHSTCRCRIPCSASVCWNSSRGCADAFVVLTAPWHVYEHEACAIS